LFFWKLVFKDALISNADFGLSYHIQIARVSLSYSFSEA